MSYTGRGELRRHLFMHQNGYCHYCSCRMTLLTTGKDHVTVDHKLPRSKGGSDMLFNLVGACWACNNFRKDIPYDSFVLYCQLHPPRTSIKEVMQHLSVSQYVQYQKMYDDVRLAYCASLPHQLTVVINKKVEGVRRPFVFDIRETLSDVFEVKFDNRERELGGTGQDYSLLRGREPDQVSRASG